MNTNEKFAKFDALVVETGISEDELTQWFDARKTSAVAPDVIGTSSTGGIKSIFPIAYKKGNEFEILPELILERKDEVWGYEIIPNIILAKKMGADGNVKDACWYNANAFAKKCVLNGKKGHLPSNEVLKQYWNWDLKDKIQEMDKFLRENGIDAEREQLGRVGLVWCSEGRGNVAYLFNLYYGGGFSWMNKADSGGFERLAVTF